MLTWLRCKKTSARVVAAVRMRACCMVDGIFLPSVTFTGPPLSFLSFCPCRFISEGFSFSKFVLDSSCISTYRIVFSPGRCNPGSELLDTVGGPGVKSCLTVAAVTLRSRCGRLVGILAHLFANRSVPSLELQYL